MNKTIQTYSAYLVLFVMGLQLIPQITFAASDEIIYPLKQVSKLECRFEEFATLSSDCKQDFLVLNTSDYNTYAKLNGGYNDYTRTYTVLWGSSYKYGWDVGSGGHQGTDIATAKGTPVYSIADGIVIEAGTDLSWGNYISIKHTVRGKTIVSNYAHLSKQTVSKGQSVNVGQKIGEVGSTGNSTGNHLHFQIDLVTPFHPYYYDYSACPYSYYEITETGVCFEELKKNTLDPLAFLESNGAILDKVSSSSTTSTSSSSTSSQSSSSTSSNYIFNVTVYYDYGTTSDIKEVQKVMAALGYYNGSINGNYGDVEESVIQYQLSKSVISARTDDGAGWFGPKTRVQAQKDYLALGTSTTVVNNSSTTTDNNTSAIYTETVSRENLMTREEIEAKEVEEFLRLYNINFANPVSQINVNDTKVTTMQVGDRKGKDFKGNTPGNISFIFDESKLSVFPKSFYNFSDGERDISITGKVAGHTTISVKVGEVIVKTFSISVTQAGATPKVDSAKIYMNSSAVLGAGTKGIVLMKDQYGNKLVRSEYQGTFEIDTNSASEVEYCIKRGKIQDILSIYKRECYDEEYTKDLSFDYSDTIGGLLIFDYKVLGTESVNFELTSTTKTLAKSSVSIKTPLGLSKSYSYYDTVMQMLQSGIATGMKQGYFQEENNLSQYDAVTWIKNVVENSGNDTAKIALLNKEASGKYTYMTREEFLNLTYKYLGNQVAAYTGKDYRDTEKETESRLASVVGNTYTWKDTYGENYFQPEKTISRGEATYFLTKTLEAQGQSFLVKK